MPDAGVPDTGMIDRPEILAPAPGDPARIEAFIPTPCVQNHAAFLLPLPGGDMGCVWFGGTQEGVPDISVHFSRLEAGADRWSPAERLSDDPTRSEQNPLLFHAPDGKLWLLWTAQISGNQPTPRSAGAVMRNSPRGVSRADSSTCAASSNASTAAPARAR